VAIWQFKLFLLPEQTIREMYGIVPSIIPEDTAETFLWWGKVRPPPNLYTLIDAVLPRMESWSDEIAFWGKKHGNTASVGYADETLKDVAWIEFRIDAQGCSDNYIQDICALARQLQCVLMTADYRLLQPDAASVFNAIRYSLAQQFVNDPEGTLMDLGDRITRQVEKPELGPGT
jgi:hypothetical protein